MAVSQAFIEAGKRKARNHALQLIVNHVPTIIENKDAQKVLQARRGLDYARELGRQHSFEHEVIQGIARARELLTPVDNELEAAKALFAPPMKEAAE
jgi:hypothetical protein